MVDKSKKSIDDMFLEVLTGKVDLDVTGQFMDNDQINILEDAELLREAIISMNEKDQAAAEKVDVEESKNRFIDRLKKENLL